MGNDDHSISDEIMKTYYAKSFFPTDEEALRKLGIDPTHVFRIHNGPETSLAAFQAQVEAALEQILAQEDQSQK